MQGVKAVCVCFMWFMLVLHAYLVITKVVIINVTVFIVYE